MSEIETTQNEVDERAQYEKRVFRIRVIAIGLVVVAFILAFVMVEFIRRDTNATIEEYKEAHEDAIDEKNAALNAKREAELARDEAIKERDEMARKFKDAERPSYEFIPMADDFVEVVDVKLEKAKDAEDKVLFSAKIKVNGEQFGARLEQDTTIIVRMKDGTVREYKGFIQDSYTVGNAPEWDNTYQLPGIQIDTSDVADIEYIKLKNVPAVMVGHAAYSLITGEEYELYSAAQ